MATIVVKASGIVRAAAYMAKMADAFVGVSPAGRTSSGFISPVMEKPLATTTFSAVRAEATPILSAADRGLVSITDCSRALPILGKLCVDNALREHTLQNANEQGIFSIRTISGVRTCGAFC